jgi:hypothetical protein
MPPPVFRFAPSPNGYLHLGHAYSALLNFDSARESGGQFLLRIEDIDLTRCRPEFETAIYEDLGWLGIAWETPVRRQSEHLSDYRDALARLSAQRLVYPTFESRAELARLVAQREANGPWPRDPDGVPLYPGMAKSLSSGERARLLESGAPFALRLDIATACARRRARLDRARRGSRWRERRGGRPAGSLGRRHPCAQGDADQLSPLGRDRRRLARRCGVRTCSGRPVCIGCCSNCLVCRSRPTGTTASFSMLPGESSRSRRRPPACANSVPAARHRPISAVWSACADSREKTPSGVTPRGRPCHGGAGQGQGNHGAKIALTAHRAAL